MVASLELGVAVVAMKASWYLKRISKLSFGLHLVVLNFSKSMVSGLARQAIEATKNGSHFLDRYSEGLPPAVFGAKIQGTSCMSRFSV